MDEFSAAVNLMATHRTDDWAARAASLIDYQEATTTDHHGYWDDCGYNDDSPIPERQPRTIGFAADSECPY